MSAAAYPVRDGEDPWTQDEVDEVRAELHAGVERLARELDVAVAELNTVMKDSSQGAGDDEADVGAKAYERDQELSLAANQREMLSDSQAALTRLDDGTFGTCTSCGSPVGKLRLQAFPRASLCVPCKQKQERR